MTSIIQVSGLSKTYASGLQALKDIYLDIRRGEIFALLGPNGAGKTTLINIICGIVNPTRGIVLADGRDTISEYRTARSLIGLVPQELTTDAFETVWATVAFSRGLFGKPPNPNHIEKVLRKLSLWEKKDSKILTLSGGMKRRVMITKGEIILVEDKTELMRKLGKKQLTLQLQGKLAEIPSELAGYRLELASDGSELVYTYDKQSERADITALLADLNA